MFKNIKGLVMDVDGVLTDGTFWWGANGEELKRYSFSDTTGISLARDAGLKLALISGDSSESGMKLVQRLADKLKILDVYKGCHDKAFAVCEFAGNHHLDLSNICYIGDDLIDLPAFAIVGLSIAPANAQAKVKARAHHITTMDGGKGAVREVIDAILDSGSQSSPA